MIRIVFVVIGCLWSAKLTGLPEAPGSSGGKTLKIYGNTLIRVLIERARGPIHVSTFSSHLGVQLENARGASVLGRNIDISLSRDKAGFLIDNKKLATNWFLLRSGDGVSPLAFQGHAYRGSLRFGIKQKKIFVINELPLETYLLGTLGAEMSPSWEPEALKAQAVASRTYALSRMEHSKEDSFDLEDTIQAQVYEGSLAETPTVRSAVQQTAGEVLTRNGQPIRAFYHARCGGITDSPTSVWQGSPAKPHVKCPFCQNNPFSWKATFTIEQIRKATGLGGSGELKIASLEKSASGRITLLKIFDGLSARKLTSDELRNRLGYHKLKSALFHWKIQEDHITFEGLGFGHGVGMCQWGAQYLAKTGKTYQEILKHFYPNSTLVSFEK